MYGTVAHGNILEDSLEMNDTRLVRQTKRGQTFDGRNE